MSRLKEQRLWDAMREGVPKWVRLERLENAAGVGLPDVLALSLGRVTLCELKAVEALPVRRTSRVLGAQGLSVAQRNWHMTWHQNGGRALIIIGAGVGRARQHVAVEGRHGDRINEMPWDALLLNSCCVGLGAAFWPRLAEILKGADS